MAQCSDVCTRPLMQFSRSVMCYQFAVNGRQSADSTCANPARVSDAALHELRATAGDCRVARHSCENPARDIDAGQFAANRRTSDVGMSQQFAVSGCQSDDGPCANPARVSDAASHELRATAGDCRAARHACENPARDIDAGQFAANRRTSDDGTCAHPARVSDAGSHKLHATAGECHAAPHACENPARDTDAGSHVALGAGACTLGPSATRWSLHSEDSGDEINAGPREADADASWTPACEPCLSYEVPFSFDRCGAHACLGGRFAIPLCGSGCAAMRDVDLSQSKRQGQKLRRIDKDLDETQQFASQADASACRRTPKQRGTRIFISSAGQELKENSLGKKWDELKRMRRSTGQGGAFA